MGEYSQNSFVFLQISLSNSCSPTVYETKKKEPTHLLCAIKVTLQQIFCAVETSTRRRRRCRVPQLGSFASPASTTWRSSSTPPSTSSSTSPAATPSSALFSMPFLCSACSQGITIILIFSWDIKSHLTRLLDFACSILSLLVCGVLYKILRVSLSNVRAHVRWSLLEVDVEVVVTCV